MLPVVHGQSVRKRYDGPLLRNQNGNKQERRWWEEVEWPTDCVSQLEIDGKEADVSVMTEREEKWWEQVEWSTDSASQPVINRKEEAACSQMEPLCLGQEHTPSVKFAVDPAHTKVLPGCQIAIFSDRTKYDETPRLEFQIDKLEEKVFEVAGVVSFPHVAKLVKRRAGPPPGFGEQASTVYVTSTVYMEVFSEPVFWGPLQRKHLPAKVEKIAGYQARLNFPECRCSNSAHLVCLYEFCQFLLFLTLHLDGIWDSSTFLIVCFETVCFQAMVVFSWLGSTFDPVWWN